MMGNDYIHMYHINIVFGWDIALVFKWY